MKCVQLGWQIRVCQASFFLGLLGGLVGLAPRVLAQSITSADDNVGTVVTQDGSRIDITGGTISIDGGNQFHSFDQFNLSTDEIANFLSTPGIENILSRIIGGDISVIDGLLRVSGSDANLFLMNSSGFILGPNTQLDLLGSLSLSAGTGINFENGSFGLLDSGDYANLVGNPIEFEFGVEGGPILNAGELEVAAGETVSLVGGTVVNTGTVETPGGNISVTAVPGTGRVQLRQPGWVIGLEIEAPRDAQGQLLPITPMDLATLLTEGAAGLETGVVADADGAVTLAESGVEIPTEVGTAIVSGRLDASSNDAGQVGGEVN
ncbi:MAG: filamentous hemagglutinin N-terminal domain-containing protein, partial [Cyanobacteria bacterium J06555_13]